MKNIILDSPGHLQLIESDDPAAPKQDEVLVRVQRVGICGTDLHAFAGHQNFFTYPRILGHELAVEVLAIGPTDQPHGLVVGDVCSVIPYLFCGTCRACQHGTTNCCENMQVLGVHVDGGMRERFCLPVEKLIKADGVPVEQLALVEMLAIGAHAVNRVHSVPDPPALVIGAGPIGLATAQFALLAGASVLMMDIRQERLRFCGEHLDVMGLIDATADPLSQIQAAAGGLPLLVFDATGSSQSMHTAFDYVAHGGQLVFVGHIKGDITFKDPQFHAREMTLLASRNATRKDFDWVIDALQQNKINLSPWITHHATLNEVVDVFPTWTDPATGVVKAMLTLE